MSCFRFSLVLALKSIMDNFPSYSPIQSVLPAKPNIFDQSGLSMARILSILSNSGFNKENNALVKMMCYRIK